VLPGDAGAPPEQPGSPQAPAPRAGGEGASPHGAVSAGSGGSAPQGSRDGSGSPWQPARGGPPAPPSVSLPKGGGAIRDIGEKFSVNAATGTASVDVPITTSPGRAGFGPSLSLTYDSGVGNSPVGLGWHVAVPAVTRKTDKGLPRYQDDPDLDTFMLSGAEDLVPVREERDGSWVQVPEHRVAFGRRFLVQCYRPRIEGLFARIERWRDFDSAETHWRSISSDNVTTVYGATPESRIADPADPARVFSWLICESFDDTGNAAVYGYAAENSAEVDVSLASERNRTELSRSAGRYPKRIRYGNRVPRAADSGHRGDWASDADWMFEVVFDYGDHDERAPWPEPARPWPCRPDPFSTYRPCFEVRTYRRCHRVLMFHHFPDEPGVGANCLVGSTDLTYTSTGGSGMTTVASVTHTGYRRRGGGYHAQSLPPLEFGYSRAVIGCEPRDLSADALRNLPVGIDGAAYQWLDLDGVGISGVLARQGGAWFYKANLGEGRFASERMLATQPAAAGGAIGSTERLLDLAGDGHLDLAELGGPMPGFYERTFEGGWRPFRPFRSEPDISWSDPDLRMVDLNGDGLADVLITSDDAFTWYPSLSYDGFGEAQRAYQPWDEEKGPRVVFADPEQAIYLADMTGDGLLDLVRVWVGEVCYWPNTGFGSYGTKITMDGIPWLDEPELFDQRRVRLADVDGSGMADLVYLHRDGARVYLNQSGNGFGQPEVLPQGFPRVDSLTEVMVADLLGRGTACLVWSSPLPGDSGRQLRYLDLMTAGKPYLLTEIVNNLGAETRISYASSTKFYLADQAAGRDWVTRLPFSVQVVEKVETIDRINRNRFTTLHAYHHGYYDGFEREFRGFGMVETRDTEELAVLEAGGAHGEFANQDPATDLPPVLTRTWLHTGVFPGEDVVTRLYAHEYYRQPGGGGPELPDTALPSTLRLTGRPPRPWLLTRVEAREACRALKGSPLREEVYALDGSEAEDRPYSVTEYNYTIEMLQPALHPRPDGPQNYHGIFLTHARESVTAHYERTLYRVGGELRADPRISHELVLAIDDYGNPLHSASAGYGRRYADPRLGHDGRDAQRRLRLTSTEFAYTNPVDLADAHRTPMPCEERTFEILGLAPGAGDDRGQDREGGLFGFAELRDHLALIRDEIPFQDWNADSASLAAPARRLIARSRVRYRRDDLSGALPLGELEPMALPYRSYRQAMTNSLVTTLYEDRISARMLGAAGYLRDGQDWWLPSGRVFFSPADDDDEPGGELDFARRHFFLPVRFRDPFGNTTTVTHDRYDLLVDEVRDPLGNLVTAGERDPQGRLTRGGNDYRVLAPHLVSDANRNRGAVAFDTLGRVCGTAVMGKPGEELGDTLDDFDPDPDPATVTAYFADPFPLTHQLLGGATTRLLYDLGAYQRTRRDRDPEPAGVAVLARETHVSDLAPGERTKVQRSFSYSDGFGREVQHKGQAAAGPLTEDGPEVEHRWIGSGWTVFNNKGKPVRSYEPFFTATNGFEFARIQGVSSVLFYDPAERVIATLHPDDSYEKAVFDPWRQETWDQNDTLLLDPRTDPDVRGYTGRYLATLSDQPGGWQTWYARRADGGLGPAQQRAAEQTILHAGTPAVDWFDPMGRTFLTVAHNRVVEDGRPTDEYCRTLSVLDIQGNQREVRDALDRAAMRYVYPMLQVQVATAGMDIGGGGLLPDVTGKPVYAWNSRGFVFTTEYDELRRPVRTYVAGPGIAGQALQSRTEYGESMADPEATNQRTRVHRQYDGAGVLTNEAYDFKGNLLRARRQLARDYRDVINWAADVPLEDREYQGSTSYDALNRPTSMTTPDDSTLLPSYDPASQLDRLDGRLRGARDATAFIRRLEYNARGQRTLTRYGNDCVSRYSYDPLTFRLVELLTVRGASRLQALGYVYDPFGNPTQISDRAQQRAFFRNRVVGASDFYRYDPLYRLTWASGREHLGQTADGRLRPLPPSPTDAPRVGLPQPGDGAAMARYRERYVYDEVGNLLRMAHRSADPASGGWQRAYAYSEPSLLEPDRHSNRLTSIGPPRPVREPGRFRYDEQGNTTAIQQILRLAWDQNDWLHATSGAALADPGDQVVTYYVYDATGKRIRKVNQATARAGLPAARKSERVYVGPFEIYREYGTDGAVTLERESLHVLDDSHRVALVETRTAGHDRGEAQLIRYQLANQLESSLLELDQDAQIISYEEYYPYGCTSYQAVRASTETPKRYRYTGRERDPETGLYHNGKRSYAPWLARWTSCDPAGLADGVNLYAYVRGQPIQLSDSSGTVGTPPPWFGEGRAFQTAFRNLVTSVGQKAHSAIQKSGFIKSVKGGRGFIDHALENRSIETKLMDIARKSYRAGQTVAGQLDLSAVAARARSWLPQLAKYEAGLAKEKVLDTLGRPLRQTLVVGIKGAVSETEAQAVLNTVRGVLASAGVKAGGLLVGKGGDLSTMTGKALTATANVAKEVAGASKLAQIGEALAPIAKFAGKAAGPVAAVVAIAEVATAHTTAEKADAAVTSVSAAAGLVETAAPVVAAATGVAAAPVAAFAGTVGASVLAGGYVGGKVADIAAAHGATENERVGAATLAGAATGAAVGAVVGSIIPVVGTGVGALVGGAAGAVGGFVKSYWR
jgi:RHS repeat-associated protein